LYDYGHQVAAGLVDDPGFLLDWAEADETLDPTAGPEVRRRMALQANPHAGQFGLLEHVERRWHEIPAHEWLRYFANRWVSVAADSWLPPGEWEQHRRPGARLDESRPFVAAIDMGLKHDTTALRTAQPMSDGGVFTGARPWVPLNDEALDVAAIEDEILRLHATGHLTECTFDPAYFMPSAQRLLDLGVNMTEFPQSSARMVPACGLAYEKILAGLIVHDDDPISAGQVTAAVAKTSGEGWRLSKGRSRHKVDSAIALVMALDRLANPPAPEPNLVFAY
jgi:phage terminase large subunit-like protein